MKMKRKLKRCIFLRYGADGKTKLGYDCAMIPGGVTTANSPAANYEEFCGGKLDKTIRS